MLTGGLLATVFALVKASDWGWTSISTLGLMAAGFAALVGFWFVEHRVRSPIVDFSLFRNRPYLGATAAAFEIVAVYWTLMFYEPQHLQNILGYSAVEAGLVILTQVSSTPGYGALFPGLLGIGLAFALVYALMPAAAMAAMPKAKAGIASAGLAMNRILAGAIGLAVVGAVFQSLQSAELKSDLAASGVDLNAKQREQLDGLLAGSESARDSLPDDSSGVAEQIESIAADAFTYALGNSIWVLVGIAVVCTGLTAWLVEPKQRTTELPEAARQVEHHHHRFGGFHL